LEILSDLYNQHEEKEDKENNSGSIEDHIICTPEDDENKLSD